MSSIITVSQLNRYISLKIGGDLKLKGITVKGELSDFKIHYKSGHAYFTLKDETALIKGVMFSRAVSKLGFMPQSGMSVLCCGNIEVYEAGGAYQIIATEIIPSGIGAKYLQLNAIKEKLTKQGVFAEERKKELPQLPSKIAVVTSLNGAALQDILNIMKRRYPVGELEIFPAQVQGETAHNTIVSALQKADLSGADVIILTRGGGSFEDLMPFNTEEVATAVANCKTPVISAVGHETDTTLADYAADKRAPTPSAAAEICAPTAQTLKNTADIMKNRLDSAMTDYLYKRTTEFSALSSRLKTSSPISTIKNSSEKLSGFEVRLKKSVENIISTNYAKFNSTTARLSSLNPLNVLERGYTITLKDGSLITNANELNKDDEVVIKFKNFAVKAKITEIKSSE